MTIYGEELAEVYDRHWRGLPERLWPFILGVVQQHRPGARAWLDLCCGTGLLLAKANEAGYQAVGLDASAEQLRHARRNAPDAALVRADVRDFRLPDRCAQAYDVVTCTYSALNYMLNATDLRAALSRARQHLTKGGIFVFDMYTPAGMMARCQGPVVERTDEAVVILEAAYDPVSRIEHLCITGFVRRSQAYRRFEEQHIQRAWTADEVRPMLADLGLDSQAHDGDDLGPARDDSRRLVYVCREKT